MSASVYCPQPGCPVAQSLPCLLARVTVQGNAPCVAAYRCMCLAAGSSTQEDVDPQERKGALWDTYRRLVEEGWTPDVHSYTTSFRSTSPQTSLECPTIMPAYIVDHL